MPDFVLTPQQLIGVIEKRLLSEDSIKSMAYILAGRFGRKLGSDQLAADYGKAMSCGLIDKEDAELLVDRAQGLDISVWDECEEIAALAANFGE